MTKKDKVTVEDIIGIVHTDETTNSVEEVCKLRGRKNITEKRFTIFGEWHKDCVIDEIRDNTGEYVTIGRVVDLLNENEQLKKDATTLIYANQDYRQQNQNLQKQLDYIQNSITNAIKHQKTELGQKALREIIEDYNEWLLGHKELQE